MLLSSINGLEGKERSRRQVLDTVLSTDAPRQLLELELLGVKGENVRLFAVGVGYEATIECKHINAEIATFLDA